MPLTLESALKWLIDSSYYRGHLIGDIIFNYKSLVGTPPSILAGHQLGYRVHLRHVGNIYSVVNISTRRGHIAESQCIGSRGRAISHPRLE